MTALKQALEIGFSYQRDNGIAQKAVVFTESKRTQKYIAAELRKSGYSEDDILLFNGDFNDTMTKEIYRAWQVKNFGNANYGRSVEYKHAIVDYFKEHAKILICTDAGSEGLNLQFCNTVINYDLPWNPMKIEQRIGRCHRYGAAERRGRHQPAEYAERGRQARLRDTVEEVRTVRGVFGASDTHSAHWNPVRALRKCADIYQSCNTTD